MNSQPITTTAPSKTGAVKLVFEQPANYLNRRHFDITIRAETVKDFLAGRRFERVLDIGCGDGSISQPIWESCQDVTLLDLSTAMLSIAASKIPAEYSDRVHTLNENVMTATLQNGSYDLILCVGVFAHVDSPAALVARITSLLKNGGTVVAECSDSQHFMGKLVVWYQKVLCLFKPKNFAQTLNRITAADIVGLFEKQGFKLRREFRYSLPLPGSHKVFSQETMYKMVRFIFGAGRKNRNKALGNQYLFLFERD